MAHHPIFFLHLAAPNTPNGNPNRVYVAIDVVFGDVVGAWDEGYRGTDAIPDSFKGAGFYGTSSPLRISVSSSEAKGFLKEGRAALEKNGHRANSPSDDNEAQAALRYTFGPAWRKLSALQRDLMTSDVILLYEEEEDDGNVYEDVYDAAVELRARIGGSKNLLEYAKTLEAGERRRN